MALNYTTYVAELANLGAYVQTDQTFVTNLPACIDYAEQRIYRELDLLDTSIADYSTSLANGSRQAELADTFVVVDAINVLSPQGASQDDATRNPLTRVSKEVLLTLWPSTATQGVPEIFAMLDQWTALFGPTPDQSYQLEVLGTFRPVPLSAANPDTFLTDHLPDLFLAASMIQISGFMRNFSSSGNDPQMPVNWETQYEKLLASAISEEQRKFGWGASWTTYPVSQSAQPQRG